MRVLVNAKRRHQILFQHLRTNGIWHLYTRRQLVSNFAYFFFFRTIFLFLLKTDVRELSYRSLKFEERTTATA